MKAMADLFSTDYGLFSVAGLLFMLFMAVWFYRFFMVSGQAHHIDLCEPMC
jgi:hypothetical protein